MTACITPGTSTFYRVWLRGRLVCATNCIDRAHYALGEAMRAEKGAAS